MYNRRYADIAGPNDGVNNVNTIHTCKTHTHSAAFIQQNMIIVFQNTVKREQNETYYDLINEFYKITGVPILFNTSFNLAGEPLVETLEDAINTIMNSDIEYLYLPEIGKLIKYSDNLSKNVGSEETQEEAA